VDSYDVFLLQGMGRRRWQVSRQRDRAFVPGLPLKILERFEPGAEWVLEPGDMLYLPPNVSHYGVAETECLTWSIGFRAPANEEIARGFLDFLHDGIEIPGQYRDPGAEPAHHPGAIPGHMLEEFTRTLRAIRWSSAQVRAFAGRFLSEPKAHVFFDTPARPMASTRFKRDARRHGLVLDRRSRLLFSGSMFFVNGEAIRVEPGCARVLRRLADRRRLAGPIEAPGAFWELAHGWYRRGFLHIAKEESP
jgi:50S ribosomal protein L16 3-hydroxylase